MKQASRESKLSLFFVYFCFLSWSFFLDLMYHILLFMCAMPTRQGKMVLKNVVHGIRSFATARENASRREKSFHARGLR